jgi:hypothetical protein
MHDEDTRLPDHGPFTPRLTSDGQLVLDSDDFHHDVLLRVSGDFGAPETKQAYGKYLADILNRGCRRARAQRELEDTGGLLRALDKLAHGPEGEALQQAADEIAKLRVALAETDEALRRMNAHAYLTNKTKAALEPSPFAQALEAALAKR